MIYDHRCLCLYLSEINTFPVTFDMPSIIIVINVCVLQRQTPCVMFDISSMLKLLIVDYICIVHSSIQYTLLFDLSSMIILLIFVFSRVKYRALIVRHMVYDHYCLCLCLPELHCSTYIYDISFYVWVFQSLVVCPYCSHIIYDHRCLCPPEINIISSMFDISSTIVAIHLCVF